MRHPVGPIDPATIVVTPVGPEDGGPLAALFQLYVYDFSELLGLDVGDDGRFATTPLDAGLADPRGHTFVVRAGGRLAGFAMVQARSRLSGDESVHDVAQLFVVRKYRRHGVGAEVARRLFDRFPGRWEVRQEAENHAATVFWRRVIDRYTGGRFTEELLDDARWRGPVQRFDSRLRAVQ